MAAPEGPETGDSAQQRALSQPGSAGDQERFARACREGNVRPQQLAFGQLEIQPGDLDTLAAAFECNRLRPSPGDGDFVHLFAKPGEPLDDRLVLGNLGIRADDE